MEEKAQAIGHILEGLRPPWMEDIEFGVRMGFLAAALPGKEESIERVRTYVDAVLLDLNERLARAEQTAKHEQKLDRESALVDDTADGAPD